MIRLKEFDTYLQVVVSRIENMGDVLNVAKAEVERSIAHNFNEEAFGEEKWAKRKQKAKKGQKEHKLLQLTGKMRRGTGAEIRGESVVVPASTPYAVYHHDGTPKMAKRRFVGTTDALKDALTDKIKDLVSKKFKK